MLSSPLVCEEITLQPQPKHAGAPKANLVDRLDQLSKKPLSFWFLNQWLEEEELSRQIYELKEKGFGGFFLHPRGGLEVPYGSRRWYEVIEYCIREAERLGLEAWLYDEDPYPSGAAGGEVTLENPGFRAMELTPSLLSISEPGEYILDLPPGMLHSAALIDANGSHAIDGDAGLVRTQWKQSMRSNSYYPPYDDHGTPHWRAETHSPHFRIVTSVESVPATLLAFVKTPIAQNPWGDFPDLLNPDAVDAFIRLTHERYSCRFSQSIGGLVPGIFTDESKLRGFIPWSASLERLVKETGGVTLGELLPHLLLQLDERTPWFRWVFREALARGFLSSFAERIREACQKRGLLWTGHFSPEEDPVGQVLYVPGLFRLLTRMDIPGTDLIGANLGQARFPLLHLSPKLASSAAHLSGKPYVACEALAVCDWVQDFDFINRAVHWLFSLGVNRIVVHGQYYSIDGLRKREAPPSQFYQAASWEHMLPLTKQIELLGDFLSRGRHSAPVLLYYPEEMFMAQACCNDKKQAAGEYATTLKHREKLGALVHQLLTSGYDFDLIDAEHLASIKVSPAKRLLAADEEYQIILIPGIYLTEATWAHLSALRDEGAELLFIEEEVTILSPQPWKITIDDPAGDHLLERLERLVSPLWKAAHPFTGHLRETEAGPLLFLCNNAQERFCGSVELAFPGPYEICEPAIGHWALAGRELSLELPAGAGVLIRQARAQLALHHYTRAAEWSPIQAQWGNWRARPDGENCLLLSNVALAMAPCREAPKPLPLEAFYTAPIINLASPSSLKMELASGVDRYFLSTFEWSGEIGDLRLVCDTDLMPKSSGGGSNERPETPFYLNGIPLPPLRRRQTFDPMNLECSLADLLREGRNALMWVQPGRAGECLPLPYDGVRLFGNFHAELPFSHATLAQLKKRPEYYLCGELVPPQLLGHGQFPGIVEYSTTTSLAQLPKRIALRFGRVFESIEVIINGTSAGHLWKEPYLLEIDRRLLREGENLVALRCATSPANYLLGLQRPAGVLGPIEWCGIRAG